jgi:hypothetical protein
MKMTLRTVAVAASTFGLIRLTASSLADNHVIATQARNMFRILIVDNL